MKFNTDIVARLFGAGCLAYPPLAAYTVPTSVSGQIQMSLGEFYSIALFSIMFGISLIIVADVIFNSVLKNQHLKLLSRYRDNFYMAAALCTIVVPFTASRFTVVDTAVCFLYLVFFLLFVALSWCDSYAKKNTVPRRGKT